MEKIEEQILVDAVNRMNIIIYLVLTALLVYGWYTDQLMM